MSDTTMLLARHRAGDASALDELAARHLPWLLAKVRHRLTPQRRRVGETMDFVQETLVDFLRGLPSFSIENGRALRGLLLKILENRLLQEDRYWGALRRDLERVEGLPSESAHALASLAGDPADALEQQELIRWARLGLELVEPAQRRVLLLRCYEGQSWAEIGAELGKSADAARMFYNRSVARLGEAIRRLRDGGLDAVGDGMDAPE